MRMATFDATGKLEFIQQCQCKNYPTLRFAYPKWIEL